MSWDEIASCVYDERVYITHTHVRARSAHVRVGAWSAAKSGRGTRRVNYEPGMRAPDHYPAARQATLRSSPIRLSIGSARALVRARVYGFTLPEKRNRGPIRRGSLDLSRKQPFVKQTIAEMPGAKRSSLYPRIIARANKSDLSIRSRYRISNDESLDELSCEGKCR
jgi:hypothetical protein